MLSIAIHLIFGPFIQFKPPQQNEKEVEKVSVSKKTKVVVPTPPPPTPTPPPPTPQPKQTPPPVKQTNPPPQPKLKVEPPKTKSQSVGGPSEQKYNVQNGSQNGVPQGQGTGPPAPAATGAPATPAPSPVPTPTRATCANPNADAQLTRAVEPDYPDMARQQGAVGTVQVKVTLDNKGNVLDTSIYKSAGNASLDQAALKAARASGYSPETENCVAIGGSYLFRADFNGQ